MGDKTVRKTSRLALIGIADQKAATLLFLFFYTLFICI